MEPKMGFRDLAAVLEVAESGSFSGAAERLWVSRASMSEHIKKIERQIGVKLFDRTTRSVKLTPAGRTFVDHAGPLMVDLAGLQDAVREAGELPRGVLRIGLPAGVVNQQIWHVISIFHRDYPEVELVFVETTIDELLKAINKGELDLSVVSWPAGEEPSGMNTAKLVTSTTGVAVSPDHALARSGFASSEDLATIPLVTFVRGFALRTIADEYMLRAGVHPVIGMESSVDETVSGLVRANVGYSIITTEHAEREGLVLIATEIPSLDRVTGLAWSNRGELTTAAAKLRNRITSGNRLAF